MKRQKVRNPEAIPDVTREAWLRMRVGVAGESQEDSLLLSMSSSFYKKKHNEICKVAAHTIIEI